VTDLFVFCPLLRESHHGKPNHQARAPEASAALPTTFVSADEATVLTQMLELELEQASLVAGGLIVRCCACHCCSCH
jgi:hypothetical protein